MPSSTVHVQSYPEARITVSFARPATIGIVDIKLLWNSRPLQLEYADSLRSTMLGFFMEAAQSVLWPVSSMHVACLIHARANEDPQKRYDQLKISVTRCKLYRRAGVK